MMHVWILALAAGLATLPQQTPDAQRGTETRPRFEDSLSLRGADGSAQPVRVSLRDWVVENRQTATLAARGMLVVHVRAGGRIVTTIDGNRTERNDDQFFVVPAGSALTVQTGDDTSVLTILEVQR